MNNQAETIVESTPMQTESIAKLADALAKAQAEIKGAVKDSENPHFKSKYADLASVWAACREPLSKNGLAVVQQLETNGDIYVVTTLAHVSGEWIKSKIPVLAREKTPQAMGSAITYMRRYSLAAMVGVAPDDDDDGERAEGRTAPKPTTSSASNGSPIKRFRTAKEVAEHARKITEKLPLCDSVKAVDEYAKKVAAEVEEIGRENKTVLGGIHDQFAMRRDMLRQGPVA